MKKRHLLSILAFGFVAASVGTAHATPPNPDHQITICHATHSTTNPYNEITVDVASVQYEGHLGHESDLIPAPEGGCPEPPEPTTTTSTTVLPTTPTTVPPVEPTTTTTAPTPTTTVVEPSLTTSSHPDEISPPNAAPVPVSEKLPVSGSTVAPLIAAALILLVLGFLLWNESDRW